MNNMNYVVYKHTSPSGKVYIGITCKKPEHRWNDGKGYSYNAHFWNAIQKYGWDNFEHEILFSGLPIEEAKQKEIELIAKYDSTNKSKGYNMTPGGDYRLAGGEKHPLFGRKRPSDVVEKVSLAKRGKRWTIAQRRASEKYYATHRVWNYGLKTPPETIEKLRKSHLGQCRPHTAETIRKISEGNSRFKKAVVKYSLSGEFISKYESIKSAAREIGQKKCITENIRQCCHGDRKSAYGYKWKFVTESDVYCLTQNK